jgi:hypothetical protein
VRATDLQASGSFESESDSDGGVIERETGNVFSIGDHLGSSLA